MGQEYRVERDTLGEVRVPAGAYYGAQTQRAVENFAVSGLRAWPEFVWATAAVKRAAAEVHAELGLLDQARARAIAQAAAEVMEGKLAEHFVVDVFQAGAGTSHNMNVNEVVANRAAELLGGRRGDTALVHPNDHVNMGQSTNDVVPTAMRLACLRLLGPALAALEALHAALAAKGREFDGILKSGRTHLQDAVPIRLGQEFGAYAQAVAYDVERVRRAGDALRRVGIGGTAVGTGINTHPEYHPRMVRRLSELAGLELRSAGNLVEAVQNTADFLDLSGALRVAAATLIRIANDLRLLASGPRTGLDEITLPVVQPGSSIMPGKVNPVLAEMLDMACFQVVGNDTAVLLAVQAGQLELNVMMPLIAWTLPFSLRVLTGAVTVFTERCVAGITANEEQCRWWLERNLTIVTALNPYIGYAQAAEVAKQALAEGKPVRQVVLEQGLLSAELLDRVLDPHALTEPRPPLPREQG